MSYTKEIWFDVNDNLVPSTLKSLFAIRGVRTTLSDDGKVILREHLSKLIPKGHGPPPPMPSDMDEDEPGEDLSIDPDKFEAKTERRESLYKLERAAMDAKTDEERNAAITKVVEFLAGQK
jgi:hypothetical protein